MTLIIPAEFLIQNSELRLLLWTMPNRIDPTTSHSKVWVVMTLNVEITVGLM
jgi:hypothetical protein